MSAIEIVKGITFTIEFASIMSLFGLLFVLVFTDPDRWKVFMYVLTMLIIITFLCIVEYHHALFIKDLIERGFVS